MPFHLSPISRRRFLSQSATLLSAFGLGQTAWGKTWKPDPDKWALLSDTHIAADAETIARGINMASHLSQVTDEIIASIRNMGGVIINGDCALQRGEKGDYTTFVKLVSPLRAAGLPLHLTLGNHDNRDHIYEGLVAAKSEEGAAFTKHISVIETPRANWFLLDSLDKVAVTPGLIGEAQRGWLAKKLDANSKKPAIVVAHHQIDGTPGGMQDHVELLEVLRPRKQVKAYIFGHTHRWKVTQDSSGIHMINLPTTAYIFQQEQPRGWVHATLQRTGMDLKLTALDKKHPQHGEVLKLKWRKG